MHGHDNKRLPAGVPRYGSNIHAVRLQPPSAGPAHRQPGSQASDATRCPFLCRHKLNFLVIRADGRSDFCSPHVHAGPKFVQNLMSMQKSSCVIVEFGVHSQHSPFFSLPSFSYLFPPPRLSCLPKFAANYMKGSFCWSHFQDRQRHCVAGISL